MASIFQSRSGAGPGSGGKIVRTRRTLVRETPYERPKFPIADAQRPNWVSRFIVSPTRSIASGAGKLLSFVIDRESSSSYHSSTSDADSSSEDEIDSEDQRNLETGQDDIIMNENKAVDADNYREEPLQSYGKAKSTIEQLLMQKTFSREEAERLVYIIRSRVIDSPISNTAMNIGTGASDVSSTAVLEAKKWLQEKKSRSESKLDRGDTSYTWNSNIPDEAFEDGGSPADLAKTYMQNRPPWASPLHNVSSPSPIGVQLFREDAPYSTCGKPSISKAHHKRDYFATGSWNIQDVIRRVRSRATEEMLKNVPSSKLDYSSSATEHGTSNGPPAAERQGSKQGENVQNIANLADASVSFTAEQNVLNGPDSKKKDQTKNDAALAAEAAVTLGKNQDLAAVQISQGLSDSMEKTHPRQKFSSSDEVKILAHRDSDLDHAVALNNSSQTTELLESVATEVVEDLRLNDENFSASKVVGAEGAVANGCPSSVSSLRAGHHVEQSKMAFHEGQDLGSSRNMTEQEIPQSLDETCELMISDGNVNGNAPVNGDEGAASGSQNSSSALGEELQQNSEKVSKASGTERQRGKRLSKYNRRGKGRGK